MSIPSLFSNPTDRWKYMLRRIIAEKLANLKCEFKPLAEVTRDDLRGSWVYYRYFGFSPIYFAVHDEVAFWLYVHYHQDDYIDAWLTEAYKKYETFKEYLEDIFEQPDYGTIQDEFLNCTPSAVNSSAIGAFPIIGNNNHLNKFEIDILSQYYSLTKIKDLI